MLLLTRLTRSSLFSPGSAARADLMARMTSQTSGPPARPRLEWHYYQHLLENGTAVFAGDTVSVVGGDFATNGQLVTLDQNDQVHAGAWTRSLKTRRVAAICRRGAETRSEFCRLTGKFAALAGTLEEESPIPRYSSLTASSGQVTSRNRRAS